MVHRLLFCAVMVLTAGVASADKIDDWARAQMAAKHIPGMVVGVYKHGKPLKVGAYGYADLENRVKVRRNSIFEACSISKQFTAVAILLLAEDGKLGLDDPVGKHIPEWPAKWSAVTIRHLLNHTSGINDDLHKDWERPLRDLIAGMEPTLTVPVGHSWEYSNFCYLVAGHIVARASGTGLYEFIQTRILDKLGMKDTHPNDTTMVIPRRVRGYRWDGKAHTNQPWLSKETGFGAGGLITTADDLNLWSEALKRGKLLSPASRALMLSPGQVGNGDAAWPEGMADGYGLGVFLAGTPGHRIEKHSGGWADASAQLTRLLDEDVTVVVLTNFGGWADRAYIGEALGELVTGTKLLPTWTPRIDPEPTRLFTIDKIFASIVAKAVDRSLVAERLAKSLSAEGMAEEFKGEDAKKLRFVKVVRQGPSQIYVYRKEQSSPEIAWFLFDENDKLENLGSFPILKSPLVR